MVVKIKMEYACAPGNPPFCLIFILCLFLQSLTCFYFFYPMFDVSLGVIFILLFVVSLAANCINKTRYNIKFVKLSIRRSIIIHLSTPHTHTAKKKKKILDCITKHLTRALLTQFSTKHFVIKSKKCYVL